MKVTLTLFVFSFHLAYNLEWKEWEMDGYYRRLRPWTCCSVCPDGNTNYYRGRCLSSDVINKSRPLTNTDIYIRQWTPLFIDRLEACCYFCGEFPTSYMLACTDPDRMASGCPLEMLYCKHNIEGGHLLFNPSLNVSSGIGNSLSCYGCMAVASFINEIKSTYKRIYFNGIKCRFRHGLD